MLQYQYQYARKRSADYLHRKTIMQKSLLYFCTTEIIPIFISWTVQWHSYATSTHLFTDLNKLPANQFTYTVQSLEYILVFRYV